MWYDRRCALVLSISSLWRNVAYTMGIQYNLFKFQLLRCWSIIKGEEKMQPDGNQTWDLWFNSLIKHFVVTWFKAYLYDKKWALQSLNLPCILMISFLCVCFSFRYLYESHTSRCMQSMSSEILLCQQSLPRPMSTWSLLSAFKRIWLWIMPYR